MKKLMIALLALGSLATYSQSVPGYMGKRMAAGYRAYLFPSFFNPNNPEIEFSEEFNDRPDIGVSLNYQHHFTFEYSMSKKYSLIGDINYAQTYINVLHRNSTIDSIENYTFEGYPGINAVGFSLTLRKYRQHFSPIGSYVDYRAGYTSLIVDDFVYTKAGEGQKIVEGGTTGGFVFGLAFGTTRVIADQWQIDFGVEFAAFTKGWDNVTTLVSDGTSHRIVFDDYWGEQQTESEAHEALLRMAEGRYLAHLIMNLKFGVSYLF